MLFSMDVFHIQHDFMKSVVHARFLVFQKKEKRECYQLCSHS